MDWDHWIVIGYCHSGSNALEAFNNIICPSLKEVEAVCIVSGCCCIRVSEIAIGTDFCFQLSLISIRDVAFTDGWLICHSFY